VTSSSLVPLISLMIIIYVINTDNFTSGGNNNCDEISRGIAGKRDRIP